MDEAKSKLIDELAALYKEGAELLADVVRKQSGKPANKPADGKPEAKKRGPLNFEYQAWYTRALPAIRQLLPERYREFQDQYRLEKRNEKNIDFLTYTISDYLVGLKITRGPLGEEVVNPFSAFASRFQLQLTILSSAGDRIESSLADIEGVLQTGLYNHELEAAEDLLKKNHRRAAGALAGVSLETHLGRVCGNHTVPMTKRSATISDLNEALKTAGVLDVPTWRLVQRLGDIRNLCVHAKDREPTNDEVADLLAGTRKILATVF
jgi:hypothetical protein